MRKKYSRTFWVSFWVISGILLISWFFFLQGKDNVTKESLYAEESFLQNTLSGEVKTLFSFGEYFLEHKGEEQTFLVLFQNNWELRPGGGFIGSFGIITVKDGSIEKFEIHDTSNFDGRIADDIVPPYPMEKYLNIPSWKFRDSNWSPDFGKNAEQALFFYKKAGGEEEFDGVIGITANVLLSLLEITGPVELPGYPGVYEKENAIYTLEHQVEVGYRDQDISVGDRKGVMRLLGEKILEELFPLSLLDKVKLATIGLENLQSKDIQVYFSDAELQNTARKNNWSGEVDTHWNGDFLMVVDANLGAYKSDPYIQRSVDYTVDFQEERAKATLEITYEHTAPEKNWLINDYTSYTRIYVPSGAWLNSLEGGHDQTQYGNNFNKKMFGTVVKIPVQEKRKTIFSYLLPEEITEENYSLKIVKQPGVHASKYTVNIIAGDGSKHTEQISLEKDAILFEEK